MGKTANKTIIKIIPVLLLIAIWLSFVKPYIFKGLIPFPSDYLVNFFPPWNASYPMPVKNNAMPDVVTQIYPWKKITIESWKDGQIPLWNTYSFAGTPHAANFQSAVFSPFNALFFLMPFIDAWSVMILLQPIVAGLGMYVFLRSLARSSVGSLVGSIGFMFCGFMVTWMAYGTIGYTIAFLPWAFTGVSSYFQTVKKKYLLLLTLSIFLSLVSGHFQMSLYVVAAIFSFLIYKFIGMKKENKSFYVFLFLILGICLAAPQLFLTGKAYMLSTRSTSFIKAEIIPWQYLITLFSPDFYGNPVTRNDWFGHYAEWSSYIGVVPLMLAVFAIVSKFRGYIRFFTVLACFSFFLAYRTPLNNLLFALKLPVLSTSAASRIIVLVSFSLAALSAFGFDELAGLWKEKKKKSVLYFITGWVLFLGVLWLIVLIGKPFPENYLAIAKRNLILPSAISIGSCLFMFTGSMKKRFIFNVCLLLFLAVIIFDSYRYAVKWIPFEPRELMYPKTSSLFYLENTAGYNRVFGNVGGEAGMPFHLSFIEGYDAMYQAKYGEFINAGFYGIVAPADRSVVRFDKAGKYKNEILELLGVRYIYQRKSDGQNVWAFPVWEYAPGVMVKKFEDEHYEVYEYTKAFPRAFFASSYEVITDKQVIIDRLFSKFFDRGRSVILEKVPLFDPKDGDGSVEIVKYRNNSVEVKTSASVPKILFLSDVYDDGWEAAIDGKKTPVYRADYDFRAVSVPQGVHTVEFRYHPKEFRIGVIIFFISVIVLVISLL